MCCAGVLAMMRFPQTPRPLKNRIIHACHMLLMPLHVTGL